MLKQFTILGFSLALLFSAGCATTIITSEPPGADIVFNGSHIGQTPMEYEVSQPIAIHGNRYRFTASKEGFKSETLTLYETPSQRVGEIIPPKIHFILTPLEKTVEGVEPTPEKSADKPAP